LLAARGTAGRSGAQPGSSVAVAAIAMSRAEICQKRSHHFQLPNAVMSGADHASARAFGRTLANAAAARARQT
jgi:hypothetical protein